MTHRLNRTIAVGSVLLLSPLLAQTPKGGGISDIDVKVETVNAELILDTRIGQLFDAQLLQPPENKPYCRAAAVAVAQRAVEQYGYEAKALAFLKDKAGKIKDLADAAGADRISRLTQFAENMMDCFYEDERDACFGRTLVTETADWLSDFVPKSGNKLTDKEIQERLKQVRDKASSALFPGEGRKVGRYRSNFTFGECSGTVTTEFQWPGPAGSGRDQRGGIWVRVEAGDCGCKKPLKLDSGALPTHFRAQTAQIKNCGLGRFQLTAFLPMTGLDTDVSWNGPGLTEAKALFDTLKKLRKGEKTDKTPDQIIKDIQQKTEKLTDIKTSLTLRPVFAQQFAEDDVMLEITDCDDCDKKKPGPGEQPAVTESVSPPPGDADAEICGQRCHDLNMTWFRALLRFLDEKKPDNPSTKGLSEELRTKRIFLQTLRERVVASQQRLEDQRPGIERQIEDYKKRAEGIQDEGGRRQVESMVQRLRDRLASLQNEMKDDMGRLEDASRELSKLENQAGVADAKLAELENKADNAKAAYYECAKCCWAQARARPDTKVPKDIADWEKEHPVDPRLVGTWRSETIAYLPPYRGSDSGGAGIVCTIKEDGTITMDYNGMEPFRHGGSAPTSGTWTGTASGHIKTCDGRATIVSVESSDLNVRSGNGAGAHSWKMKDLGVAAIAERSDKAYYEYTCDETTLKYQHKPNLYTFKRVTKTSEKTATGTGK